MTHIDGRGMPSSSTPQPFLTAVQREALLLEHGQHVLEIGAGTVYNAALLGEMVGNTGRVISIDIDEDLMDQAKALHLWRCGKRANDPTKLRPLPPA